MSRTARLERLVAPLPTELADAVSASRLVLRVAALLEARLDAALLPLNLTMRDYLALVLIADAAVEPLRPSDLGVTLDATRTQVTRLLDGLERHGLVERLPGREDRRTFELALTPAGKTLVKRAGPLAHGAYAAAWAALGTTATRQARGLLTRLHDAIDSADETP